MNDLVFFIAPLTDIFRFIFKFLLGIQVNKVDWFVKLLIICSSKYCSTSVLSSTNYNL